MQIKTVFLQTWWTQTEKRGGVCACTQISADTEVHLHLSHALFNPHKSFELTGPTPRLTPVNHAQFALIHSLKTEERLKSCIATSTSSHFQSLYREVPAVLMSYMNTDLI